MFKKDRRTKSIDPRLRLNETDNDFFIRRILSRPDDEVRESAEATKGSHKRLAAAASLAKEYIENAAEVTNHPEERLNDIVDYLQDSVRVIWLTTTDESNAFVIFETLNDRGLELAISDLLKNYLFSQAKDRIDEIQAKWISMVSTLETASDDRVTTEFIRHYWSSHYGATRKQDLYAAIKKRIRTKKKAVDLAIDLERASQLYSAMLNTDHEIWKKFGPTARADMATMNNLGMVQIRPLVLAVLDNGMTLSESRKAFRSMVSWGVRFLIVGGLGGGTLERHYADGARTIRSKDVTTAAALQKQLAPVLPQDQEFQDAFAVARVAKANIARYYLSALEVSETEDSVADSIPNPNADAVNLEHVLPKSLSDVWRKDFGTDAHAAYFRRIGNLALMRSGENSASGNSGFGPKKKALEKSAFALTRMIGESGRWTPEEIEKRQKHLASLAVQTWPLNSSSRRTEKG